MYTVRKSFFVHKFNLQYFAKIIHQFFLSRDYFEYALVNRIVSRLLRIHDTALKRRAIELPYGYKGPRTIR